MAGELAFYTMLALFLLIVVWERNKQRQKPESKTPYDYALQNARERNESLSKQLSVIRETQRIEEQNKLMEDALERELSVDFEDSFRKLHDRLKEAEAHRIHKISTGDTLSSIAKEYGTTEDVLIKFNSIRRIRDLAVGNTLKIPEEV